MQIKIYTTALFLLIGFVSINAKPINETICKGVPPNVIVLLPHPENCSLFIECANEVPVVFACPEGLHWNTNLRECDFPENANCRLNKTVIETPINNNQKWASCEQVPENTDVLLPNPSNCETYIQCVHQKPVIRQCPSGLEWNSRINECDWPQNANCQVNACEGVSETQNVLLPNPKDCETFIQCVHQKPVIQKCPSGLQWNNVNKMCDWPYRANCNDSKTKSLVPKKQAICEGVSENTDVLLPNPENCETYIQCVHQKPMVRPCPAGLHWNSVKKVCDWPEQANCKRNICDGVLETENVLMPNPEDCGSFIQCVHQEPVVRPCPVGLHWNASTNRCDWPHIAHCNNVNP